VLSLKYFFSGGKFYLSAPGLEESLTFLDSDWWTGVVCMRLIPASHWSNECADWTGNESGVMMSMIASCKQPPAKRGRRGWWRKRKRGRKDEEDEEEEDQEEKEEEVVVMTATEAKDGKHPEGGKGLQGLLP
jgi:hypothetical protein